MNTTIAYGNTGILLEREFSSAEVLLSKAHLLASGEDENALVRAAMAAPIWKIPWTEEPDGLQSMGSLRVRHD